MFYPIAQKLMFACDAEWSHNFALGSLKQLSHTPFAALWRQQLQPKPVTVAGIRFDNPLGLAAGLDKNAECIDAFGQMGFGFIEVGTITPRPQLGNDKPRIFRLPQSQAIINRMGFNNKGVDYLVHNVKNASYKGVLGINIGKNKDTPNEQGKDDYVHCMRKVYAHASYITVNISSPNTPGLRDLQFGDALLDLLQSVKNEQLDLQAQYDKYVPVFVKIAPDMDLVAVQQVAETLLKSKMDGVVATNTTLDRSLVQGQRYADEAGGLSGLPVRDKSTQVLAQLRQAVGADLPIIGVGGISDAASAQDKLAAGANLLQVYTGFIYRGPALIKEIVDSL
ncbi:MAG: quinone-dependent dihydroorotate dehydrogenase [Gammaproteobacteria bacterium]|nr:quinone-dependent dihydroorotate dehydrogenase [Gammaproteobacteria bacterium]MBU1555698.1 quinone-dependent dihydroorotate dehydrogenase [Gammaproteobacteria bacterium]MBU2072635.1 quinone-dependent dihydroorotate dehydrogenase [Gammaproteobacteria bacterium]MBU2182231.1 quinone-dependent dihydroorotate dehydrogenase [Gammaproteobacteria bacterium]MBU2204845.1 quinone-dependent dihydroorotate dehydrogenase [Gammaproteobacteria bacterium]